MGRSTGITAAPTFGIAVNCSRYAETIYHYNYIPQRLRKR